ncbi:MAG: L,D-transpeptidase family protein [Methylobacteriaceae bacterium]|jgi:murein L,D-transpeptidase YcbB/YkuD|nr:L,D-transpeptidase family protein [Methylobacteriaceae bacterium]
MFSRVIFPVFSGFRPPKSRNAAVLPAVLALVLGLTVAGIAHSRQTLADPAVVEPSPATAGQLASQDLKDAGPDAAPMPTPLPYAGEDPLAPFIYEMFTGPQKTPAPRTSAEKRLAAVYKAVEAFYAGRGYRPLWYANLVPHPKVGELLSVLRRADENGLKPADYNVSLPVTPSDRSREARADIEFSLALVRYARDARGGRLEPWRIHPLVTPKLNLPEPEEVLSRLLQSPAPHESLAAYQPHQAGYLALRRKLAETRNARNTVKQIIIPDGPTLKAGMSDPRVPLLYERLQLSWLSTTDPALFDKNLSKAVAGFQKQYGLKADGLLTPQTVKALNRPENKELEADIIANMERWRWLPEDLGTTHVFVNIPELTLHYVENGREIHSTRVIVGKADSPTPVFSHRIEYFVVNPYWTVPPTMLRKEFLPAMANDPGYASRRGYQVSQRGRSISVRQPPGPRNSLGYIKFMFPNDHSVYLHDTPNRNLFNNVSRALSHGCVRVEKPFYLAELLMRDSAEKWDEARLRKLIGKNERRINLTTPVPIHLAYFTLEADESGRIRRFNDVYRFHQKTREALGL